MTKQTNIQELSEDAMKKLDWIIGVDCSPSMGEPSTRFPSKSKFDEMEETVKGVALYAEKYDDDGITVFGFSRTVRGKDGVKAAAVRDLFSEWRPGSSGSTNLAGCIKEIHAKARASGKECLAIIWTDGSPDDADAVVAEVTSLAKDLGRPKVGLVLVQVGNDKGAKQFLEYLDDQLSSRGVPDVVSTLTEAEAEDLSLGQLAWLGQNA